MPPEPDLSLSPYTGWTRAHWLEAADHLLASAQRYRSPGGGLVCVPGPPSRPGFRSDGVEGFARTFLLAAFRHVGTPEASSVSLLGDYVSGALRATDPAEAEAWDSWPAIGDAETGNAQLQVEAASIALSLHLTRRDTWDALSEAERDRLDAWLRPALARTPYPNNWYLFPLTVASFLEAVDRGDRTTARVIERGLGLLDEWYRGDGWYSDGSSASFDHYNGWALHYYPLLHAHLRADDAVRERYGRRLREFLETFARTFDRDGGPLYMGRSMTYRWAALASLEVGHIVGHTPLAPGQSRRLMSTTLRYFLERGALQDGIPLLGWHGAHAAGVQFYSGAGSPYWASKGFTALMLPADDALWTAVEESLPGDTASSVTPLRGPGLLVQTTAEDGLVRVHNHGSDRVALHEPDAGTADPMYSRLAYSTRTGPTQIGNVSDNDVQVCVGGRWSARRRIHRAEARADWAASWHTLMFPTAVLAGEQSTTGAELIPSGRTQCVTVARGPHEVRAFRLSGVPAGTLVRASGWAVAAQSVAGLTTSTAGGAASVRRVDGSLASTLSPAAGAWHAARVLPAPAGTAFGPWAAVPELFAHHDGSVLVCTVVLTAGDPDPLPAPDVGVDGSRVRVGWADGPASEVDFDEIEWPT